MGFEDYGVCAEVLEEWRAWGGRECRGELMRANVSSVESTSGFLCWGMSVYWGAPEYSKGYRGGLV